MRPGRAKVLLTVTTVAVVLAGCGQFGSKKTNAAAECTGPGISPGQIKIGAIYPDSGNNSGVFQAYRSGIDARLGVANSAGGVNGRQVSYAWADDQGIAGNNLGAAQQLVLRDNVFSIVELSTATNGGAKFLNQQAVPVVGTGLDAVWSTYRNMFSYTYFVARGPSVTTWGDYIHAQGGTRAALLYSSLSPVSTILTKQWSNSLAAHGIQSDPIEATPNVTSADSVARQIKANHDDTMTGVVDTGLFAAIAERTNQIAPGQLKVILSAAGYDKEFLDAFGKALPNLSTFISYAPFESHIEPAQKFLDAMIKYSPQVQPSANEIALEGWIDTDMTLTGLAAAGACPTRASFMTGLRNVTQYDAGGLLVKPVDLKTNFGQLNLCYSFLKIDPSGTKWDVVSPSPFCGKTIT